MADLESSGDEAWVTFLDPYNGMRPVTWSQSGTVTRADAEAMAARVPVTSNATVVTR